MYIIFYIFLFVNYFHCKYLIYPFVQNKYDNLTNPSEISAELLSLEYFTNITIAEPPQTIRSFIDFTKFHFYISNVSSNREYILEKSRSFNTKYDHDIILYTYSFVEGKYANETLYLNLEDENSNLEKEMIQIKNFSFSMPSNYVMKDRKMFPSSIGLGFYAYNSNYKNNFLTQLHMRKILNNTYFFLDFENDDTGKLYLGVLPHELDHEKFKNDNFYRVYTNIGNPLDEWSFKADFIFNYDNNDENKKNDSIYIKNIKIKLDVNLNGIILDHAYLKYFNQTFFYSYFDKNICKFVKSEYNYIYCQKDKIDINNFKSIYFYQKDFNYTFKFDFNDLFIIKHNYIFFNIFFDNNGFEHLFIVGKILFKKYLLAFDYEQKMISFYFNENEKKGLIIENNNNNIDKIIIFYLIAFILVIIISFLLFKYCYGNNGRKIRKNEIDENYDYTIKNDDE